MMRSHATECLAWALPLVARTLLLAASRDGTA